MSGKRNNLEVLIKRGSSTAKGGFSNEKDVVRKFNNWGSDEDAKKWLELMNYELSSIENVKAEKIKGSHKTDVQVQIKVTLKNGISLENISIKLVSNPQGFNQIDKRWIDKYVELWAIPEDIVKVLKMFTGETKPSKPSPRDGRRIFLDELDDETQKNLLRFFEENKLMIVSDLFQGRDLIAPGWMIIYQKKKKIWTLLPMSLVINFYGNGPVSITAKGSMKIGEIGMQRKGGDGGRKTSNMLQFKINPCAIVSHGQV